MATERTMHLVNELKEHALAHYSEGGWDVVIECFSDAEIAQRLADVGALSLATAIAAFDDWVQVWADQQADARNSAF